VNLFRFVPGYEQHVYDADKEPLFFMFLAFLVTFALVRRDLALARGRPRPRRDHVPEEEAVRGDGGHLRGRRRGRLCDPPAVAGCRDEGGRAMKGSVSVARRLGPSPADGSRGGRAA
jgi:hypothetical protein